MEELFTALTRAVEGSAPMALTAALVWGVLSIVLSPCHLSSIPLIVGFISEQGELTLRRAFGIASLFSLGILATIAAIGAVTAAMGRLMGQVGAWGNYLVAGVFLLVGLHLLDIVPMPFSGPGQVGLKRRGLLAAFLLGLVFGIALGPCTFAFMAPVLAVSFKVGADNPAYAALLLAAYGVGHCAVIVAAGTFTGVVERYLRWNERSKGTLVVRRVCGVLVLAGGVYMIHIA
ncbi:MAG: cytochrome C biogenesis protein [Acidobacteria bacterium]|nr:cytochrome C biogenesis protein [Acidobacteriota bacterium]